MHAPATAPDTLSAMRRLLLFLALVTPVAAQQPFTLQQVLSAPYALSLTAAPVGARFAWIENAEGVRNIWVGGPSEPARQITNYTDDDGQDISNLAWSPDGFAIAYTYGAESGASGKPANPANLQRNTALQVHVTHLFPTHADDVIGEGHAPLYSADGNDIFFLRGGQIWIAPISGASGKTCWLPEGCPTAKPEVPANVIPRQLVFDRGSASQLTLSPDGKQLAFVSSRSHAGHSQSFIALFDLATNSLRILAPSTQNDFAPTFSPDGKSIAWLRYPTTRLYEFGANRTSPNPWSIQVYDFATNTARTVFSPEPNKPGSILPHMATGEPRLMWTFFDPTGLQVKGPAHQKINGRFAHLARASFTSSTSAHNSHQKLSDSAPPPDIEVFPWLLFTSEQDGFVHLFGVDPQKTIASAKRYMEGDFDAEDVSLTLNRSLIFFSSNSATDDSKDVDRRHIWSEIGSYDFGGVGQVQITTGPGIETHPSPSADGKWIAVLASSGTTPMHVEFMPRQNISAPGGSLLPAHVTAIPAHPLSTSNYPTAQLFAPKQVLFPSTDNLTIHGQLFLTPHLDAKTKHPAIIYVHGGPRRQMLLGYPASDYYSNGYAFNQYLASRGFIVLSVNYRCGIGYGLNFRECEHAGPTGAAEYNDILAAQKYLASRADVDTTRIGLWGGSYGGYLTALGLARNSDLFAAGVDFYGVHEWSLEDDGNIWPRGNTPAEAAAADDLAHASSPMADVGKWCSPALFIHGDDDPDVAFAQTPLMADALRARGVPVEELIFPNEVHDFLLHKDWLAAFEAAASFFERTLKP